MPSERTHYTYTRIIFRIDFFFFCKYQFQEEFWWHQNTSHVTFFLFFVFAGIDFFKGVARISLILLQQEQKESKKSVIIDSKWVRSGFILKD